MPPPSETASQNTPLAPSVEKAYYRKCIQLKRRLNEVEGANEELKIRRVRLDRSIMKMRLERAFLLDELRKRMDQNIDGSEASEDERTASVSTSDGIASDLSPFHAKEMLIKQKATTGPSAPGQTSPTRQS